jgi:hydroxymethylpyrimidine pyrophosphatase-like HAD family hydrolase
VHYVALACDYDGTLATDGRVDAMVLDALERLRKSGRKLLLVTGREIEDLERVFPKLEQFDHIVAENGAVLYQPAEKKARPLAEPPPAPFIETLRRSKVAPLSVGHVIVATREPHETIVLKIIRELGLELQIIFNKGAVMVLPSGVNKATGLQAALGGLGLSPHNVAAIGDAENDHAFLRLCGCSAAVANALPMIKETADIVTAGARGAGVIELIEQMLQDDLAGVERLKQRHRVLLGEDVGGEVIHLPTRDTNVLLAGTSGGGKSTLSTGLLERLSEEGYQFCVIDPEGDYERFERALVIGDSEQPPNPDKVLDALDRGQQSIVVNLLAIKVEDRPRFFAELLPNLQQLRNRTARPHWIVVDEAHHMLPPDWQLAAEMSEQWTGVFLITVHPDKVAPAVLKAVDTLIVLGRSIDETVDGFRRQVGWPAAGPLPTLEPGEALLFLCEADRPPQRFRINPPKGERQRHVRKYAEGKLADDRSFYFRGPEGRLNLRAHNLELFMQIADGVDDETWLHHLRAGDYSRWFRKAIKDDELSAAAAKIESRANLAPAESRAHIRDAIEKRYTGAS